jgi:hypothetical protein
MQQATAAEDLLLKLGWRSEFRTRGLTANLLSFGHAEHFTDDAGHALDLHWRVLHRVFETGDDDEFWAACVPAQIGEVASAGLNPADQLLHICQHGAAYSELPPMRWVADAVVVLQTSPELDWHRLLAQARRHHLALPLRETMRYLSDTLGAAIPPIVLQELQAQPITKTEQRTFRWLTSHPDKRGPLLILWSCYHTYAKLLRNAQGWRTIKALLLLSQQQHRIKSLWAVPFHIALRWTRRIALSALRR